MISVIYGAASRRANVCAYKHMLRQALEPGVSNRQPFCMRGSPQPFPKSIPNNIFMTSICFLKLGDPIT